MRSEISQFLQHLMKSVIGTYLARYWRSFAEVLHISSWVFGESAGVKETFWEMNKARIYKGEQQIRGAHPDYKRVWSDFVQNLWTLSRGEENSVLVYVLFNVPEELSSES